MKNKIAIAIAIDISWFNVGNLNPIAIVSSLKFLLIILADGNKKKRLAI
jgi:hypothetical protein